LIKSKIVEIIMKFRKVAKNNENENPIAEGKSRAVL
jgi:hypothetical protein